LCYGFDQGSAVRKNVEALVGTKWGTKANITNWTMETSKLAEFVSKQFDIDKRTPNWSPAEVYATYDNSLSDHPNQPILTSNTY
jgi:hypothetical protein